MKTLALIAMVLLAACSQRQSTEPTPTVDQFEELKGEISELRGQLFTKTYDPRATAWLEPTEKAFQFFNTEIGPLAISVQNVRALGDGSEVDIQFGNPTNASITKLSYHAQWGSIDKEGNFVEGEDRESDKSVDTILRAGGWNTVKVAFAGVPPSKLGRIVLSKPKIQSITLAPN